MYALTEDCEHGLSAALCAGPGHYPDDDRSWQPAATMSDAHSEWHRNAGVPMGQPGCPQDACDGDYYWDDEDPSDVDTAPVAPLPPDPFAGDEPPF